MTTPIRLPLLFRLFCVCALSTPLLLSQQDLVISGSHTSSSENVPCQAVNTITTSPTNPFTLGGTANVTCIAGGSIRLSTGFHADGHAGGRFDALVIPMPVSPALNSPTSGAGGPALTPQTFVLTFSDAIDAANVSEFQVSFGGTGAVPGICSLVYSGNTLGLWNDSATQLLQTAPLQNSQCSVNGTPQISRNGSILTFSASITFTSSFQGVREVYALGVTAGGDYHPWVDLGSWSVNAPTTQTRVFTAGTSSWTPPTGVTSVQVEAWGSGGNGADGAYVTPTYYQRGGGGGGGAYAKTLSVPVSPSNSYSIVVGAGGSTTKTTFGANVVVADYGSVGGQASGSGDNGYGGAGGRATNSVGGNTQSGADGTPGYNGSPTRGGSGGSAGGSAGGAGGLGGPYDGIWGNAPGGGGAGANNGPQRYHGGAGAAGQIVLTYGGSSTPSYSIAGEVANYNNWPLRDAVVSVKRNNVEVASRVTDERGIFAVYNLDAGQTYTVTASKPGYTFPSAQTFTNLSSDQWAYFSATTTKYPLIINPPLGGATTPSCPSSNPCLYDANTTATITATADPGYAFTAFSADGVVSTSNPYALLMTGQKTVTVSFQAVPITLTTVLSPSAAGAITPSCPSGCLRTYGETVPVSATPACGATFTGFTIGGSSGLPNPQNVVMDASKTVIANFSVAASPGPSTVSASPGTVAADGVTTSTITVILRDSCGNLASGKTVSLSPNPAGHSTITPASAVSNSSGVVTFTVKNATAETVAYTATDTTDSVVVTQTAPVTFTPGAVSSSQSTVGASPASVAADGAATSTITVTLKDTNGNRIGGKVVTLAQGTGHSTMTPASASTDTSGTVTFTAKNSVTETVRYTATDSTDGVAIAQTADVTFTALPPSITQLSQSSGPVGLSLGITGSHFGTSGAVSFKQGTTEVQATTGSWSDTSITATVPATLTPGSWNVIVTAGGVASSPMAFSVTATYLLTGVIAAPGGCPLAGVNVSLSSGGAVTTGPTGAYSFSVGPGTYTVTPTKAGYGFPPRTGTVNGNTTWDIQATSGTALPARQYIRLGGRVVAIESCGGQ